MRSRRAQLNPAYNLILPGAPCAVFISKTISWKQNHACVLVNRPREMSHDACIQFFSCFEMEFASVVLLHHTSQWYACVPKDGQSCPHEVKGMFVFREMVKAVLMKSKPCL